MFLLLIMAAACSAAKTSDEGRKQSVPTSDQAKQEDNSNEAQWGTYLVPLMNGQDSDIQIIQKSVFTKSEG